MIEWSHRARAELQSLVAYTKKRSPRGAARTMQRILKRVDDLNQFPEQGTAVGRGTYRLGVAQTPYLIFYRLKGGKIIVIGIVHGRRKRRS